MIYDGFNNFIGNNKNSKKTFSYNEKYKFTYSLEKCSNIISKSVKIPIDYKYCDYKKDIILNNIKYTRIFGEVKDDNNELAEGIYVTLYKYEVVNYKTQYIPMADTITDKDGQFQFIITDEKFDDNFKVKVSDRNYD